MAKFKQKYRTESNRLEGWDYSSNALYFVTICCHDRECFFGEVIGGKMKLSPIGHVANSCFYEIPHHFPFVELYDHIVMPNHVHGIIEIAKSDDDTGTMDDAGAIDNTMAIVETPNLGVSTVTATMVETPNLGVSTANASKKWQPNTLGTIINQYKRACTINARKINPDFAWQSNYHDHIIRNEKSFVNIANYIQANPLKWTNDTFNPKNHNSNKWKHQQQ